MAEKTGRRIRGLDAEQRRAERRELLLDAALELFAAHGYLNTSIEQICSTAYVGTKSFYEVFDSREACYVALLQRTTERLVAGILETAQGLPDNEDEAVPRLVAAFAHSLVDDPRVAAVTFGQAGAISAAVERQRRTNRRWAAGFLETIWQRYGGAEMADADRHGVAIGVVGGLFDLIADWLLDADPGEPADVERLIDDLTRFYRVVRRGISPGAGSGSP
ncbi:TetR/AcrR family transcriptional regulator [Kribbella deserti]|uniref:TetR/AcrR family transcriptional regulator n=1 Tax=Kribbella deserti TaxID=1926257 RepID=A0ABV6QPQ1_9ACTN